MTGDYVYLNKKLFIKKIFMKLKFPLLLFCLLLTSTTFFSQNKSYGKISYEKAVNLAGKQRMLSQRIAKIKVLNSVGASSTDLKAEMNSSKTIFVRNLKILALNSQTQSAKVKAMIRQEESEWNRYKSVIETPNSTVEDVLAITESLLTKCHSLVLAIEEASKFNKQLAVTSSIDQLKVETVNRAGKQRMLSQKLCLYYAACRAYKKGKNADAACMQYKNIYTSMDSVVNDLMVSEINNSEIDLTISNILNIMDTDINSQRKEFTDNRIPLQKMILTTNKLLELFNKLTSQYSL